MKIIYTSYYANRKIPDTLNKIPISIMPPKWFKGNKTILGLAPSKKLFKDYKAGRAGIGEYIRRFRDEKGSYIAETFKLKENDCLLCYEKIGDFCHRHIVAEELSKSGDLIIEYKPEYKIWVDVEDPMYGFYPHIYLNLVCDVINRLGANSKITIQKRIRLPYSPIELNIERFRKEEADLIIKTTPTIEEAPPIYLSIPTVYISYRQFARYAYNDPYNKIEGNFKRVSVYGSNKFKNKHLVIGVLNALKHPKLVINDNNTVGCNAIAVNYAKENNLKINHYIADTKQYGKNAGIERDKKVFKYSDILVFFRTPNSKNTDALIEQCKRPMVIISEDKDGKVKEEMINF